MKNLIRVVCFAVLLACTCFAAVAADAKVVSVTGKVEVQKGDAWVAVNVGDVLKKGSVISTGFKSGMELAVNDSRVTVGALTRMTVEQLASSDVKDETSLFIDSGKISANVQRAGEKRVSFKVSSPVATASVRGTVFDYFAGGEGTTHEGSIVMGRGYDAPQIANTEETSGYISGEGEATVFTPANEISEIAGVTVYAGQASYMDEIGDIVDTQITTSINTQIAGLNMSASSMEEESSVVSSIVKATDSQEVQTNLKEDATVNISVVWGD